MKRIIAMALCLLMLGAVLTGCGKEVVSSGTTDVVSKSDNKTASKASDETAALEAKSTEKLLDINDVPAQNLDAADADYQKKAPVEGEEVAVLHTNYGDISFKFFPEVAPKAVESFKALAKDGRYNNILFHRIIDGFMIQTGDYTNFNGTGGESAYGEPFGLEISDYVTNIEGSVAMANTGQPNSNGSQFYINQVNNNFLDGNYTVFGQVYEGMDVVNKIAKVQTGANDKPVNDVVLESAEIIKYAG